MEPNLIRARLQRMSREELILELEHAHSEEFVIMFLGYLCADTPELGGSFETPRLLDSWQKFKTEMGKRA